MGLKIGQKYTIDSLHVREMDHFMGYNNGEIVELVSLDNDDNTALVISEKDIKPLWHSQRELIKHPENV